VHKTVSITRSTKTTIRIGSNFEVISLAWKAIVVQRARQAGTHWTVNGAADIIARRCQHASGRWDELWTTPAASPAGLRPAI
jgi:hypothetical protein